MGALPALQTAIFEIAHLVGIATPEHLLDQSIIVTAIVPRIDVFKSVPVLDKALFEDAPGRRSGCRHQAASLQRVGLYVVALFYHMQPTVSTPSAAHTRDPPSPTSPLCHVDMRAIAKCKFLLCCHCCQAPFAHFFFPLSFFKSCVTERILGLSRFL